MTELNKRLGELQKFREQNKLSKLSQTIKVNPEIQEEIRILAKELLNREVSGCGNCYADALIELTILSKKKIEMGENITKTEIREYKLYPGAVLHDTENFDSAKVLTNRNMTQELALFHLKQNPKKKIMFAVLPKDWEARIKALENKQEQPSQVSKTETNQESLQALRKTASKLGIKTTGLKKAEIVALLENKNLNPI